jgi:hypothetical protein
MTDICGVVNCVRCFTRSLAHNTCVPSERSSSDHMSTVRARPHDMSHSRNASFLPTAAATYHISLSNFPTSYTPRRTANPPLSLTHYTFNGRRYKSAPRGLLPWSSQSQVHRARHPRNAATLVISIEYCLFYSSILSFSWTIISPSHPLFRSPLVVYLSFHI